MPMYAYKGVGAQRQVRHRRARRRVAEGAAPDPAQGRRARHELRAVARAARRRRTRNAKKGGLSRDVDLGGLFGGVKKVEIAAFTRQMATLLKAGIPLAESLGALVEQIKNVRLKTPVAEVRTAVNEGMLARRRARQAPEAVRRAVRLDGPRRRDRRQPRRGPHPPRRLPRGSQKLKSKVQGAMIYPIVMVVVGVGIMARADDQGDPEDHLDVHAAGQDAAAQHADPDRVVGLPRPQLLWLILLGIDRRRSSLFMQVDAGRKDGKPVWHRVRAASCRCSASSCARSTSAGSRARSARCCSPACRCCARSTPRKQIVGNVLLQQAIEDAKQAVTEGESLATDAQEVGPVPADDDPHGRRRREGRSARADARARRRRPTNPRSTPSCRASPRCSSR